MSLLVVVEEARAGSSTATRTYLFNRFALSRKVRKKRINRWLADLAGFCIEYVKLLKELVLCRVSLLDRTHMREELPTRISPW